MLKKTSRIAVLSAVALLATMVVGGVGTAQASDHRESFLFGTYFLSEQDSAYVVDILDYLDVERVDPADGPMPQIREHILLARVVRSADGTPHITIFALDELQARFVVGVLDVLGSRSGGASFPEVWIHICAA